MPSQGALWVGLYCGVLAGDLGLSESGGLIVALPSVAHLLSWYALVFR